MSALTKILIIAANPWDTKRLGLDEEYREIKSILQHAKKREQFELEYAPAANDDELRQMLLNFEPNIVHFSGHGNLDSLFFQDKNGHSQPVAAQALAGLFALFADHLQCIVLNACYSENQAKHIVENIDYVVGMNAAIGDQAAIKFSTGFYQALFNGKDIEFCHKFAKSTIDLANIDEKDTPVLLTKQQVALPTSKNYLEDYQYDVVVHAAETEKVWAETLVTQLRKHLTQRFPHELRIALQADASMVFDQAATNLLLLSPAYSANYNAKLNTLATIIKQQRLFLAEYHPVERPQVLNGLVSYCFWQATPEQGLRTLSFATDHDYSLLVENLVDDIEIRLKYLFQQQKIKQSKPKQQPQIQSFWSTSTTEVEPVNDAVVFVNVAAEDRPLAQQVQNSLSKNGIASTLPIDHSLNPPPSDIRRDIEINLLNCDAVLVIYDTSSPLWVKEQLLMCHRWQRKREEPLKIIALHNANTELPDIKLPNLQVFYCPPQKIDEYLSSFMEKLK